MRKRCDTEKITGSGYCLKHWINQRYFLVIAGAWISGTLTFAANPPYHWAGISMTIMTGCAYYLVGRDVDDLQNHISEVKTEGDTQLN